MVIRDVLRKTAKDNDSFEVLTVDIVSHGEEDIRRAVRILVERKSFDWILVVGGDWI